MTKSYTAYFYSDVEYASTCIEASNPQEALNKAIDINECQNGDGLSFDHYDHRQPVNHIEIFDDDRNQLAQWCDENLLLRLAAPKLLDALQSIHQRDAEFVGIEDPDTMLCRIKDKARAAIAMAMPPSGCPRP